MPLNWMNSKAKHSLLLQGDVLVQVVRPQQHDNLYTAFLFGHPTDGALVRIHSRCLYGDVFASLECDCRDQLDLSRRLISAAGSGIILYGEQEGRGAGIHAKARAYELKETSALDTFSAYAAMGLEADLRNYAAAADFLYENLGLRHIRLLTNNPEKVSALQEGGLSVERIPLVASLNESAQDYLNEKKARGHLL